MTTVIEPIPAGPGGPGSGPASSDAGDLSTVTTVGWKLTLREFMSNKLAVAGVAILVFFIAFCFLGPLVYHTNQIDTDLLNTNQAPSGSNPLGTDTNGFDVLGRLMLGGQTSLEIGFIAAVIATIIGTLWGAVAGLIGGLIDAALMRVVDILLSIPFLLVVLIVAHRYGSNIWNLSLILGVFSWLVPARLVRGEVLTLRVRDFVSAARTMGGSRTHLIFRHLIPNAMGTVIVNITFQIADAILALAALGYLNFGVHYPDTDWGSQISDAQDALSNGYWWLVFPVGAALVLVVMAFNLIGDGLRDAVDVRLRKR
ncbi:ABC transporter permease [Streptomyces sp. RB6PN25]|uniref:ABC transporter permease n=1 Tax=Streptomyces humicola TaxID=2953240 RepID=A0ABT1PR97_9ACTN|nr:ABC transporter permease [Streptomyces humicola]MCQ4080186.1 ABC transporter permease [Streptomyces humicola]